MDSDVFTEATAQRRGGITLDKLAQPAPLCRNEHDVTNGVADRRPNECLTEVTRGNDLASRTSPCFLDATDRVRDDVFLGSQLALARQKPRVLHPEGRAIDLGDREDPDGSASRGPERRRHRRVTERQARGCEQDCGWTRFRT